MPSIAHLPVLLEEALEGLSLTPARANGLYVDGTFGRGGHSRAILNRLGAAGRLVAFDKDPAAVAAAAAITDPRFEIVHASFATMAAQLGARHLPRPLGVLLDLGVSSPQIEDPARGFSFRHDGPLDMRMNPTAGASAAEWLDTASEQEIREVIRDYGEERFAVSIAKAIVARRAERPLSTTRELATLVAGVVRTREKGQDPATRTFQALRIHINQELAELEQGLDAAMRLLAVGGRLAVISFHSLEDRIVKRFLAHLAKPAQPPQRLPIKAADLPVPRVRLIAKVKPSETEVAQNPRARSAVLRVAEKLVAEDA